MIVLSDTFKDFVSRLDIEHVDTEVLEGQTAAGKTTVGIGLKFILLCAISPMKLHLLCGNTRGKLETSIIMKEDGILDIAKQFHYSVEYYPNGKGGIRDSHIVVYGRTEAENKIILCAGYGDRTKWKDILGNQYGIVAVDEANIADIDFLRELAMRKKYWMLTLNPDNPDLPLYREFINKSRPLDQYRDRYPEELYRQLCSVPQESGKIHWYFTMDDNAAMTEEEKEQKRKSIDPSTSQYKSKILGIRGKSEGQVYPELTVNKIITLEEGLEIVRREGVYHVFVGIDSGIAPDKDATAVTTTIRTAYGKLIQLPSFEKVPKLGENTNSIVAGFIEGWLDHWLTLFGCLDMGIITMTGDSAALTQDLLYEITLTTKYDAFKVASKDILRDTQRIKSIMGTEGLWWIVNDGYHNPTRPKEIIGEYDPLIMELQNNIWDSKTGKPMDGNDHCIDSFKYESFYF